MHRELLGMMSVGRFGKDLHMCFLLLVQAHRRHNYAVGKSRVCTSLLCIHDRSYSWPIGVDVAQRLQYCMHSLVPRLTPLKRVGSGIGNETTACW